MSTDDAPAGDERQFNLPVRNRLWRDRMLPRVVLPLFWLAWLLLLPSWVMGAPARRARRGRPVVLAIEAGRVGWTQVFFEELYGSACDAVGPDAVRQQQIDRDRPYLPQFRANQARQRPTHVVLDTRTPGQSWWASLREGLAVGAYLSRHGVTPIVVLTDAFYRRHRWKAAALTAREGVVLTFADERILDPIFPHRRLAGPLPMPVSLTRLSWLEHVRETWERSRDSQEPVIRFIGNWYPPRSDLLQAVDDRLRPMGLSLSVRGDKAATNSEYWTALAESDVVVTTCMQGPYRPFIDWMWTQQLVFRYNETLAAGAALVATRVPGSDRVFSRGKDFLEFVSVDEAVAAIVDLVEDPALYQRIARQGHRRSRELSETFEFWRRANAHILGNPLLAVNVTGPDGARQP